MTETMTAAEYLAWQATQKTPKYGNTRITTEDGTFDSLGEERRWNELKLLRDQGAIMDLRRQVRYPLEVNGIEVSVYTADFTYYEEYETPLGPMWWRFVVEDFKSGPTKTRAYGIRKKLMLACHGITIRETGR